ncbi:MAG: LytTR family DNA-binding domain-containing protein [Ekhidna sp.]
MKVLIVEDEAPAFRRLEKILLEINPAVEILEVFDSVEDTVKWMKNHRAPDLVFLDIQISDGVSFQIFEQVEVKCPVIFTTAFDEYMLKAFKVNSVDYLLKPIKKEELKAALDKFENMRLAFATSDVNISEVLSKISLGGDTYKGRFLVKQGDKMLAIKTPDIVCFQSKHGVVHIHTKHDKAYLSDFTLDELNEQLDPQEFCRANRQFIVNIDFILTVHKYFKGKLLVEMEHFNDEQITVSSEKASAFKQWMGQ